MLSDSERASHFSPRPYFRILLGLIHTLGPTGAAAGDAAAVKRLQVLAVLLYSLQPLRVPAFVYCWLDLISSRAFLPAMMAQRNLWPIY